MSGDRYEDVAVETRKIKDQRFPRTIRQQGFGNATRSVNVTLVDVGNVYRVINHETRNGGNLAGICKSSIIRSADYLSLKDACEAYGDAVGENKCKQTKSQ
jgi:hypothetical protein